MYFCDTFVHADAPNTLRYRSILTMVTNSQNSRYDMLVSENTVTDPSQLTYASLPIEFCELDTISTPSGIDKVYYGNTLVYQKQLPPSWHTIFEGSSTATSTSTLNYVNSKGSSSFVGKDPFVTLTNTTTNPIKLRLTIKYANHPYSYPDNSSNYYTYYKNHEVRANDGNTHTITITLDDIDPAGVSSSGTIGLFSINS